MKNQSISDLVHEAVLEGARDLYETGSITKARLEHFQALCQNAPAPAAKQARAPKALPRTRRARASAADATHPAAA